MYLCKIWIFSVIFRSTIFLEPFLDRLHTLVSPSKLFFVPFQRIVFILSIQFIKEKYNLVRGLVSAIFSTGWITFYFLLINFILQLFFLSSSKYIYLLTNCTVFSNNPRLGHPPVRVVPKLHGIWTADLTIYWSKWGSDGFNLLVSVVWLVLL